MPDQVPTLVKCVLNVVNPIRIAFKKKPLTDLPKGRSGEAESCPIARAVGHDVEVSGDIRLENEKYTVYETICDNIDGRSGVEVEFWCGNADHYYREQCGHEGIHGSACEGTIILYSRPVKEFVRKFDDGSPLYQGYAVKDKTRANPDVS